MQPLTPSDAIARAIRTMPRDGSINFFTAHILSALHRSGFVVVPISEPQPSARILPLVGRISELPGDTDPAA